MVLLTIVEWNQRNCPASFGGHVSKITSDGGYLTLRSQAAPPHPSGIEIKLRLPLVIEQCQPTFTEYRRRNSLRD